MTTYTADDFKRAEFARDPRGHIAARVCNGPGANLYAWRCSDIPGRSDRAMADDGWAPVPAGSYTRTDEEDWQARAVKAERERDDWKRRAGTSAATSSHLSSELVDARARAETAEQALVEMTAHRDQCRDTAIKWQMEANRAVQPRALTPDVITDAMVERGARQCVEEVHSSWERSPALTKNNARESVRGILEAALTEPPPRPEGADQIEADMAAWYGENGMPIGGTGDRLADHLAALGYRKTGDE